MLLQFITYCFLIVSALNSRKIKTAFAEIDPTASQILTIRRTFEEVRAENLEATQIFPRYLISYTEERWSKLIYITQYLMWICNSVIGFEWSNQAACKASLRLVNSLVSRRYKNFVLDFSLKET